MISVEKKGKGPLAKQTFPRRPWQYSEIRTPKFEFCFNMNGEIFSIRGLTPDWPHPAEHFKRTAGNDWVYYTVGDKSGSDGVVSWMGEYYLPCLPYVSNPVWDVKCFSNPVVMTALAEWSQLYGNLYMADSKGLYPRAKDLIKRILANDDQMLHERSQRLNRIIGGRISVLPPDTRHVIYDIIPVNIADGCLYHCKFCCVKSDQKFKKRSKESVLEQITALKDHFGPDRTNYHALFIGNHDAVAAGDDLICFAAEQAYEAFGFRKRMKQDPFLYLFGSVGSFLGGICAVCETKNIREILPLPIAGLMSDEDFETVAGRYTRLDTLAKEMGSKLRAPFMTLSFMALLVIPEIKLSDRGLFDGTRFEFMEIYA